MMTTEFINEHFEIKKIDSARWRFEPIVWKSPTPAHRYFLTFITPERRFILSRQKVVEPVSIDDAEQLTAFRGMLTQDEVAECMRKAMLAPPPEDDGIPF